MGKIILLALGLVLVYWILKGYRRRVDQPASPRTDARGENMVQCAHCGLHLPRSESVVAGERYFCSPDHQRLHNEGRPAR